MHLFEHGKLRLNDPVTKYLPEFQGGKSDITVRSLLTHFSGLRPDLDLEPVWSGYETGVKKALADVPARPPGVRFVYSDINFILLGEIVRKVSGATLPDYVRQCIYRPLGMNASMFQPVAGLRRRIAPTEIVNGGLLRGIVHDPTTRYMGGVAGHAGLFTTAADLGRFAEMMLGQGTYRGVRIFSPPTVRKFTTPALDRSGFADLCDSADELGTPAGPPGDHAAALQGGNGGCFGARDRSAGGQPDGL
jgi:CubicO group peptidase (beta-lactamase class C family)